MNSQLKSVDLQDYRGQWVALDPNTNQVLASGKSLDAVRRKVAGLSTIRPFLYPVPETEGYFVG
jgi:hypothetical protein